MTSHSNSTTRVQTYSHHEKKFNCSTCNRDFARLEHLQRHVRRHTKEKPFSCQSCSDSFTRRDLLTRHQNLTHSRALLSSRCTKTGSVESSGNATLAGRTTRRVGRATHPSSPGPNTGKYIPNDSAQTWDSFSPDHATNEDAAPITPIDSQTPSQTSFSLSPDTMIPNNDYTSVFDDLSPFLDTSSMPLIYCPSSLDFSPPFHEVLATPSETTSGLLQLHENALDLTNGAIDASTESSDLPCHSGSQLPSLLSDPPTNIPQRQQGRITQVQPLHAVTEGDRQNLLMNIKDFFSVVPWDFILPSRHGLSRYLAAYVASFHEHLPFLHMSSLTINDILPELNLAIFAVGARYCFEASMATKLSRVAKLIAMEQICRREQRGPQSFELTFQQEQPEVRKDGPTVDAAESTIVTPSDTSTIRPARTYDSISGIEVLQTAQAVLLLMTMATWGNHETMFREVLATQAILLDIFRQNNFLNIKIPPYPSWKEWLFYENVKRTVSMAYCLFSFQSIMYNIPPPILNSELNMELPCRESRWRSSTVDAWETIGYDYSGEPGFQASLKSLFSSTTDHTLLQGYSPLGSYILIHALIQHIYLLRQIGSYQSTGDHSLSAPNEQAIERALGTWREIWERSPESSLDPKDPHGPVAFNSTALLRIAYIRLAADMGPYRALKTHTPEQIAAAIHQSPPVERSRLLTRAAMHSAHALSIPIRLGVNLVERNQAFTWSIQHSVCSLECACLLSKWLDTVTTRPLDPCLNDDEVRLLRFVSSMLEEVGSSQCLDNDVGYRSLSAEVVRVWANLFRGERVWDAVGLTHRALNAYAAILEGNVAA